MLVDSQANADLVLAIYRTSSIGDCVLATSTLNALERLPTKFKVFWLGRSPSLQLIAAAYPQVTCIEAKRSETRGVTEKFRELARLDGILDLQKNLRSRLICIFLAKRFNARLVTWEKRGIERGMLVLRARLRGRSRSAPPTIQRREPLQYKVMLGALAGLLKHFESKLTANWQTQIEQAVPTLPLEHHDAISTWQKELRFGSWIAVAPGASFASKQAPQTLFEECLNKIKHSCETAQQALPKLLFLGDERDRKVAINILANVAWPESTLNLAGKLSLWENAQAIHQVSVILANDSSLSHIAEAVGTPCAVLFGPTVEAFGFAPRMRTSKAFSTLLGCRPCSKHGKVACHYGDQLCFKSLSTKDICNFVLNLARSHTHE